MTAYGEDLDLMTADTGRNLQLKWLPGQTVADLEDKIRSTDWNVLHFVGHGDLVDTQDEGGIYFADSNGKARRVTAS